MIIREQYIMDNLSKLAITIETSPNKGIWTPNHECNPSDYYTRQPLQVRHPVVGRSVRLSAPAALVLPAGVREGDGAAALDEVPGGPVGRRAAAEAAAGADAAGDAPAEAQQAAATPLDILRKSNGK